jgi:hypothetical protein
MPTGLRTHPLRGRRRCAAGGRRDADIFSERIIACAESPGFNSLAAVSSRFCNRNLR